MTGHAPATRDGGQSSVEFALVVPMVLVVVLMLIQVGLIMYAQIAVTHAAREIARVLVVDPSTDLGPVTSSATSLDPELLDVEVEFDDSIIAGKSVVIVRVSYQIPVIAAIFEPAIGDYSVAATAAMVAET